MSEVGNLAGYAHVEITATEIIIRVPYIHHLRLPSGGHLSRRETEILQLVKKKWSDKEISSELHIAPRTVKFHMVNLLRKLGCKRQEIT